MADEQGDNLEGTQYQATLYVVVQGYRVLMLGIL